MLNRNPFFRGGLFLATLLSLIAFVFAMPPGHERQRDGHRHHRSHYGAGHAKSLVYNAAPSVSVGMPLPADNRNVQIPTWPGCKQAKYEDRIDCTRSRHLAFIKGHLRAPAGRKGRVGAVFNVDLAGRMTEAELYEETDPFLAAEVMRLVGVMQGADLRWTPGTINGTPRVMKIGLVVSFGQRCRDCADVDFEFRVIE